MALPFPLLLPLGGGIPSYDWQGSGRGNCHSSSVAFPAVGEEPPTGGLAEETRQPMQGSQDSQDPKASRIPSSQSPHLERTPSPIRTVFPQSLSNKGTLGDTPLSKQTGKSCFLEIALYLYFLFQFFF